MMFALIFLSCIVAVLSVPRPKCQYAFSNHRPGYVPIHFCGHYVDPGVRVRSFELTCNSSNTGVVAQIFNVANCTGDPHQTLDITQYLSSFSCTGPVCNGKDNPLVSVKHFGDRHHHGCDAKQYEYGTAIHNYCGEVAGRFHGSILPSCSNSPPSITIQFYNTSTDCSTNAAFKFTLVNGCNYNRTNITILSCTHPSPVPKDSEIVSEPGRLDELINQYDWISSYFNQ